jgi:hypothetical protein
MSGPNAGCAYGQFMVDQGPKYDNQIRKRKRKKKRCCKKGTGR